MFLDELLIIKLKGIFGLLGKKYGFGLVVECLIIGCVVWLLKLGIFWMYKYYSG